MAQNGKATHTASSRVHTPLGYFSLHLFKKDVPWSCTSFYCFHLSAVFSSQLILVCFICRKSYFNSITAVTLSEWGKKNPPTAVLYCEEHRTMWSVCPFHLSQSLFMWEFGNSFSRCLWSGRMRNSAGHWSEHKHRLGSSQNDECAVQSVHLLLRARSLTEQPERCVNF